MRNKSTSRPVRRSLGKGGSAPALHSRGEGGLRRAVPSWEGGFFNPRTLVILLIGGAVGYSIVSGTPVRFPSSGSSSEVFQRTLAFADRVAYQTAIEDVYWRHRIWPDTNPGPKPSLDKVMSQVQIERKVKDYLRNSQALEDYWRRPLTADQLQAEMERMASNTRQPEVLREVFEALRNDPFVIAECLARPILTERLTADVLAQDNTGQLQSLRSYELQVSNEVAAIDSIAKAVQVNRPYQLPEIASPSGGCTDDTWTPTTLTNAPAARNLHTAVWTGSEMIVWGGQDQSINDVDTGGRYNPSTDSWTATSITNAPSARQDHTAVWTGSEMIVWGGGPGPLNTGGRYNPMSDNWTATSTINAPEGRVGHTAVWTGSEMIIWGGSNLNTGGRYNPSTGTWTATSTANVPAARSWHTAVWTDSEMIVWGGQANGGGQLNTGGRYNPVTDSWITTTTTNAPAPRDFIYQNRQVAVWTGSEMIVWGGFGPVNTGGRYNPSTDSWTATSLINVPSARYEHTAVWTGREMIVWGGTGGSNTGGRYDPVTDSWTATSIINAPTARAIHTAVWTGSEMIVWGGGSHLNTGGRYCAASPSPTPTPTATATASPSPTATATPTATAIPTATATATATATPTATPTGTPSSTPRPSPTPRSRPTPAPRP